jgi:putative component of toxin-antitoxin plasmid stabilization module
MFALADSHWETRVRIDYGPGYRVYFVQRGDTLVVLSAEETNEHSRRTSAEPGSWLRR